MDKTLRGFAIKKFTDKYGEVCSLQKSSIATDDCIWFGVGDPTVTVFPGPGLGKYQNTTLAELAERLGVEQVDVHSRMHLNRQQVEALLPYLISFVETGELEAADER